MKGKTGPFLPNTAMFTIATAGYIPFTLNLHASLQTIGLGDDLVVYTPDRSVKWELSASGVRSIRFGPQRYRQWSDFGTPDFGKFMAYKWAVALEILNAGSNVLFVDGDIVFLRNPTEYLRDAMERTSAQLIMQYESPKDKYNCGFWFARPEPLVLRLFRDMHDFLIHETLTGDQRRFNEIIRQRDGIKIHALDAERFACGNQFLESDLVDPSCRIDRSSKPFPIDSAYLLHFNYLVGKEQKVAAIVRHNALFYQGLLSAPNKKRSLWSQLFRTVRNGWN